VNAGEPWLPPAGAEARVRRMQAKLHLWAAGILAAASVICSTSSITRISWRVAWMRVSGNKGARTPGVDRVIPAFISGAGEVTCFPERGARAA